MFPFLFYWSYLKAGTVHSNNSSLFRKRSIISQLNVPAATAENEEQYTLSNIIYIGFQNSYTFLWKFFWWAVVLKRYTNQLKNTCSVVNLSTKLLIEGLQLYQKSTSLGIFKGFHPSLQSFNIFPHFKNVYFPEHFSAAASSRWKGFQNIHFHKNYIFKTEN